MFALAGQYAKGPFMAQLIGKYIWYALYNIDE
jgi:hypothetical protein